MFLLIRLFGIRPVFISCLWTQLLFFNFTKYLLVTIKFFLWWLSCLSAVSFFKLAHNGPMLCAGPAKTAETHSKAPCSNITQFSIEPPTAGLALSICYGRQMCITIIQDCSGFSCPFISLIKFLLSEPANPQNFFR